MSIIDLLLHPARRVASAEVRRRARIAALTAALLSVGCIAENILMFVMPTPLVILISGSVTVIMVLAAVVVLRFTPRSMVVPVLLTSMPLLAIIFFFAMHGQEGLGLFCAVSPWNIAVALFVADLIGARAGLGVIAFQCCEVLASYTLKRHGWAIEAPAIPPGPEGAQVLAYSAIIGLVALGALLWLYASSRQSAMNALDAARGRLAVSEARLTTLIENTDAMVASIDLQGRWVTFNQALKDHRKKLFGHEPEAGQDVLEYLSPDDRRFGRALLDRALAGERATGERPYAYGGHAGWAELAYAPIPGDVPGTTSGVTLFGRDITARKESEEKLRQLNRQVADASRQAGMAEVATGILHNVGNTLNSVNVSADLAVGQLRSSRIGSLTKVLDLMREHQDDLGAFLADDPRGRKVLPLLLELGGALVGERATLTGELESLSARIEHIKSIVSAQQQHAKAGGLTESVSLPLLLDDAIRMHEAGFNESGIEIERHYDELAPVELDRHKLLQITVNLLRNARHALIDGNQADKRLRLCVERTGDHRVRVQVADNGIGIAPEHLARLFQHGFTTKRDGHGFGLHMSALMANAMGGSLTGASAGLGQGSTFTLELPLQ